MRRPRRHARDCRPDLRSRHRGGQIPLLQKPKQCLHQYHGHDVIPASRRSSVDSLTGECLADAVAGADIVVDGRFTIVLFDGEPVMYFFTPTTTSLLGESPFLSPTVSRTGFV
jgi:hypothetical protein